MSGRDPAFQVLGAPTLSPRSLVRLAGIGRTPAPLDSPRTVFFYQARYALWHAATVLGLEPPSSVLVPAFHCGTELDPFLARGLALRFYEVGPDLQIDVPALQRAADETVRAVLVTHYFGRAQDLGDVQRFCRTRGLFLIEDCAHTLAGRDGERYLGTAGDVAVFSLRKFLPAPDGGAIRVNRDDLVLPQARGGPPASMTRAALKLLVARNLKNGKGTLSRVLRGSLQLVRRGRVRGPERADAVRDLYQFFPERIHWGMSAASRRILDRVDAAAAARRRRQNFNDLHAGLAGSRGVRPLGGPLPEGSSPWMLPILARDPGALTRHLQAKGVEIGTFWQASHSAFPADLFPQAAALKRDVVALPVHQDLDRGSIDYLVEAIRGMERPAERA